MHILIQDHGGLDWEQLGTKGMYTLPMPVSLSVYLLLGGGTETRGIDQD